MRWSGNLTFQMCMTVRNRSYEEDMSIQPSPSLRDRTTCCANVPDPPKAFSALTGYVIGHGVTCVTNRSWHPGATTACPFHRVTIQDRSYRARTCYLPINYLLYPWFAETPYDE